VVGQNRSFGRNLPIRADIDGPASGIF
jgi:hypothetical protein